MCEMKTGGELLRAREREEPAGGENLTVRSFVYTLNQF
jgi:hypothetical protein